MAHSIDLRSQSRIFTLLCGVAVVAALYFAREILLPFAIAVLLSFLLAPVVNQLEHWKFRRIPAVVLTVAILFCGIVIVGYVLATQFYDVAYKLPTYRTNIMKKVEMFRSDGRGVIDRVLATFREVEKNISDKGESGQANDRDAGSLNPLTPDSREAQRPLKAIDSEGEETPVPVEIVDELTASEIAQNVLGPLLAPLGMLALVTLFVVFILIEREDLRNRFIYLVGARQLSTTTEAIDDAAYRVSRYLQMLLIINSLYGLVIAIGLFLIGLPNAFLWGFLAMALRFIPYVGPWIAAVMPVALSLAVFPGWTQPLLVISLFIVNELTSNNVLEPWLYGASTGISTIGIIISAVFWTWLWGPVGLVLATPLTVCLTVLGRYVPQLSFINTMFSDEEVLPSHLRLYQRLVAMDVEEAIDVAEEQLRDKSLAEVYDAVLVPALRSAESDRQGENLDESKHQFVYQAIQEMIEDFGPKPLSDLAVDDESQAAILCVPARDEADRLVGLMLGQLLAERGYEVRVVSAKSLVGETLQHVRRYKPQVVCISALPPSATTHSRYLAKRLCAQFPDLQIVVGLWQETSRLEKSEERLLATGIDRIVRRLTDAVECLVEATLTARSKNQGEVIEDSSQQTAALQAQ